MKINENEAKIDFCWYKRIELGFGPRRASRSVDLGLDFLWSEKWVVNDTMKKDSKMV